MSINLNRDGQWAKFFERYNVDLPRNLCELFWKALWVPLLVLSVASFVTAVVLFFLVGSVLAFGALFLGWPLMPGETIWMGATMFALIAWLCGIVALICWTVTKFSKATAHTKAGAIAREAYRGIKEKYCPTVQWTCKEPSQ